jgi:hypothetical protein
MDLDIGALWTWTLPLWGLFALILYLVGISISPAVIPDLSVTRGGGSNRKSKNNA